MRRTGQFQEALKLANEILTQEIEEIIEQVIKFEVQLIENNDNSTHTVSEALVAD